MSRTFMVYVNVDELNASLVGLFTNEEKSQWVAGFQAGCSGVKAGAWPPAMLAGHAVGLSAYQTSEEYRAKKSQAGVKSAEVRAKRHGTAQPTRPEQCSSDDRTMPEQCSSSVRTPPELSNIQYPVSNIEKPVASTAPEHDPEDPFQDCQPAKPKQEPPKTNPRDLLTALGYAVDYFRGTETGRQEALDTMTGALALYDAKVIQRVVRDWFLEHKSKVPIGSLLGLLDARAVPEYVDPEWAAREAAKKARAERLRPLVAKAFEQGEAKWEAVTGRKQTYHDVHGVVMFAANWVEEVLTEHYPEVMK